MQNVIALGVVSFFTDFSTEMVLGVLPLFVVSSLGASRAILGTIEGSSELTSYSFRMVSGSLSDRLGKRKIFVIAGYGLSAITKPFLAAAFQVFVVFDSSPFLSPDPTVAFLLQSAVLNAVLISHR